MIDSVHILSDPLRTMSVLIYLHQGFVDPLEVRPHGVRSDDLEFLLEESFQRWDSRFIGVWEKELMYMQGDKDFPGVLNTLERLRKRPLIVFDSVNLCLEDKHGRLKKSGVDDFSSTTEVAPLIMRLYTHGLEQSLQDTMGLRFVPVDFPFEIGSQGDSVWIENVFRDIAENTSRHMIAKNKRPFGDSIRYRGAIDSESNYLFHPSIISPTDMKERFGLAGFLELNHSKVYETIPDIDDYKRLVIAAVKYNREFLKHKYRRVFEIISPESVIAYMLQGDIGREILDDTRDILQDARVITPGGGLLQNTKFKPVRGVLEPQAIFRLVGYYTAILGSKGIQLKVDLDDSEYEPSKGIYRTARYPFIIALGPSNLEEKISEIPEQELAAFRQDAKNFEVAAETIEDIIARRLNKGNFTVHTRFAKEVPWREIRSDKLVLPHRIADLSNQELVDQRTVRPSNSHSKCAFAKWLGMFPPEHWEGMRSTHEAMSGNAIHQIGCQLQTDEYLQFVEWGLPSIPRREYCEVPLAHFVEPSEYQLEIAENVVEQVRQTNPLNPIYQKIEQRLQRRQDLDNIIDGGQPDAVAEVGNSIILLDYKRLMYTFYPKKSILRQMSRYWMMVDDLENASSEVFYLGIIQTPFSALRIMNKSQSFPQRYRPMKLNLHQFTRDYIDHIVADVVIEHLGNQIISEDAELGWSIRHHSQRMGLCENCFSNIEESPKCRYTLEGVMKPWD